MSDIPHLNIDELYERKKETDSQRVSIYNKLLLKIHNKPVSKCRNSSYCFTRSLLLKTGYVRRS